MPERTGWPAGSYGHARARAGLAVATTPEVNHDVPGFLQQGSAIRGRLLVTLCHHELASAAASGEGCGAHDRVDGLHGHASRRGKACQTGRARPRAAFAAAYLPGYG